MTAFCRIAQEEGDFGGDGSFTDQRLLRSTTEPGRSPCNLSLFLPLSYGTKLSASCQVHFLHSSFLPSPHVPPSSGERSPPTQLCHHTQKETASSSQGVQHTLLLCLHHIKRFSPSVLLTHGVSALSPLQMRI